MTAKPKGDREPVEPHEYRVDSLSREQQELLAAVVVFCKADIGFPSSAQLADLLGWPRVQVNRVGRELVAMGLLGNAVQTAGGSKGTDN